MESIAEIIAIGSELLTPTKTDTNSLYLTGQLNSLGVEVVTKTIVGDDRARLTAAILGAMERSPLVLISGGLGPTEDDVTRDAVAEATGRKLVFNEAINDHLVAMFAKLGRKMAENNKRQAYLVEGAEMLPNDRGSAPGQFLQLDRSAIVLLPGPPKELKAMYQQQVHARLEALLPPMFLRTRFFRVAGMGESDLDHLIAPVYTRYQNPVTTILAAAGDIQIHLRARCAEPETAEALLDEVTAQIEPLLGNRIYSRDGAPLEEVVGQLLLTGQATLSFAESLTGGMAAQRITSVAGSAQYFLGSLVTYTDEMKAALLGVDWDLLKTHGAVSKPVAIAMAEGARARTGSTYAVSLTGFAGPDGGTEQDPKGTVYYGVAGNGPTTTHRSQFHGDRDRVRDLAVQTALDLLRKRILPG